MDDMKKDIPWINTVKVLCMIIIYFYHTTVYMQFDISNSIHPYYRLFYTNAFFFVSGYLLFSKQLSFPLKSLDFKGWNNAVGGVRLC